MVQNPINKYTALTECLCAIRGGVQVLPVFLFILFADLLGVFFNKSKSDVFCPYQRIVYMFA